MPRAKIDRTVCRYCKQREPIIILKKVKGLPVGECKVCNSKRNLDTRLKQRFALGLYQDVPDLVSAVLKTLARLQPGAYPLVSNTTKRQSGFVVVQHGAFYVDTWGQTKRFAFRLFEVASILGNQGLFIDSKAIALQDAQGNALDAAAIGDTMPLEDPAASMVWFDPALVQRAMALIRDEIRTAKATNAAIARRSTNPIKSPKANE